MLSLAALTTLALALLQGTYAQEYNYPYNVPGTNAPRNLEWTHKGFCPGLHGPGSSLTLQWHEIAPAVDNHPSCNGDICQAVIPKHPEVHVTWSKWIDYDDGGIEHGPTTIYLTFHNLHWFKVCPVQALSGCLLIVSKAGNPTPMYCFDCDKSTEPDASNCKHAAPDAP